MNESGRLKQSGFIHLIILGYCTGVFCVAITIVVAKSNVCNAAAPFGYRARSVLEMMAEISVLLLLVGALVDASSETCRRSIPFRLCVVSTFVLIYWAAFASMRIC